MTLVVFLKVRQQNKDGDATSEGEKVRAFSHNDTFTGGGGGAPEYQLSSGLSAKDNRRQQMSKIKRVSKCCM